MNPHIEGYWESITTTDQVAGDEPDLWNILNQVENRELSGPEAYELLTAGPQLHDLEFHGKKGARIELIVDWEQIAEILSDGLGHEVIFTVAPKPQGQP